MVSVVGHFDGKVFVPDDPVDLPVNGRVRMLVEAVPDPVDEEKRPFGLAAGEFTVPDDFDAPVELVPSGDPVQPPPMSRADLDAWLELGKSGKDNPNRRFNSDDDLWAGS